MDGLTLAAAIREVPAGAELPLVMLTSLGQRETRLESALLAAFLTKPVKPSRLYNVLVSVLAPESDAEAAAASQSMSVSVELPSALRILLAEDNLNNQRVAQLSLQRLGLRADAVANGHEAVTAARRRPYDVILMDVQMPELDGLEATRQIREDPKIRRQPHIIAVTASATVQDRQACLSAGMDAYISKPYRLRELRRALRDFVQGRGVDGLGEASGPADEPTPAPDEPQEAPVFDPSALVLLAEVYDEPGQLDAAIQEFLPDVDRLIRRIEDAAFEEDARALVLAAHTLRSHSLTLGGPILSQLAHVLERRGLSGALGDDLGERIAELHRARDQFVAALAVARPTAFAPPGP
ncbi:MAG: response regulator [Nannocystaceae bacterium]